MPKDRQEDASTETNEGVAQKEEPGVEEEEKEEVEKVRKWRSGLKIMWRRNKGL